MEAIQFLNFYALHFEFRFAFKHRQVSHLFQIIIIKCQPRFANPRQATALVRYERATGMQPASNPRPTLTLTHQHIYILKKITTAAFSSPSCFPTHKSIKRLSNFFKNTFIRYARKQAMRKMLEREAPNFSVRKSHLNAFGFLSSCVFLFNFEISSIRDFIIYFFNFCQIRFIFCWVPVAFSL